MTVVNKKLHNIWIIILYFYISSTWKRRSNTQISVCLRPKKKKKEKKLREYEFFPVEWTFSLQRPKSTSLRNGLYFIENGWRNPSSEDMYHNFRSIHVHVDLCGKFCILFCVCPFFFSLVLLIMVSISDKPETMLNLVPPFTLIFFCIYLGDLFQKSCYLE